MSTPSIPATGNMTTDLDSVVGSTATWVSVPSSVGGDYQSAFAYVSYPSLYTDTDVIGRKIKIWANFRDTVISPWWQDREVSGGDIVFSNNHYYLAEVPEGTKLKTGNVQPSHTEGVRSDGSVKWRYLHSGSAVATVTSVDSDTSLKAIIEGSGYLPMTDKYVIGGTYLFPNIQWSIIGYKNTYPSDIYLFQNRLGLIINTYGYGAWNCLSCSDDYFNFATEQNGQQLDTSALINLIPDNADGKINWVIPASQLYMGGYSGEFTASSGSSVATPTNFVISKINEVGGARVLPMKYNDLNLFVGAEKDQLYSIGYDYTIDDYKPKEISCFARHLFGSGIKRMAPVNNKDQNIYIVQEDGDSVLMKYSSDQKILSYSQLGLGAPIVDFASTRGGGEVMGYFAVAAEGNRVVLQSVALKSPTYMLDAVEIESPIYSEEGVQLQFNIKDYGVMHHAGKTVWVCYGDDLGSFVLATLDENGCAHGIPDSFKYRVGLPMVCELHTQPAFGNKVEGMQQQSIAVYLRLYNSGAFQYGSSVDFDNYCEYKEWKARQEFERAPVLFTGDLALNLPMGYAKTNEQGAGKYPNTSGVGVNIRCETPEPFNLLSIQEIYK